MAVSENWLFTCLNIMFFSIKQDVPYGPPGCLWQLSAPVEKGPGVGGRQEQGFFVSFSARSRNPVTLLNSYFKGSSPC